MENTSWTNSRSNPILPKAPLGLRVAAFALDMGVLMLLTWLSLRLLPRSFYSVDSGTMSTQFEIYTQGVDFDAGKIMKWIERIALVGVFLFWAQTYFILTEFFYGKSIGKHFFGLRVVRTLDGRKPGFIAAAMRDTMRWVFDLHIGLIFTLIGLLVAGKRPGDYVSGLRVVKELNA